MTDPLPIIRRRKQRQARREHSASRRVLLVVLGAGFAASAALALGIFGLAAAWSQLTAELPPTGQLAALLNPASGALLQPTRIYDRTGEHLLAELAPPGISRHYVRLDQLPPALANATLAAADPTFRSHPGCLPTGRSTLATTIATDLLLWREPASARRNWRACLMALQLTDKDGREQILEWYLNSADYGNYAYGADAAAQLYFGKPAASLRLAESALVAAVSQSPGLNPFDAPEAAVVAQRELISRMASLGMITSDEAKEARAEPLVFQQSSEASIVAPAFTELALDQLSTVMPRERIERGGLKLTTSMDLELQEGATCLAQIQAGRASGEDPDTTGCPAANNLPALPPMPDPEAPPEGLQISAAVTDPQAGEVLALVGDTAGDGGESTTLEEHPVGSLIAPFIYLTAFTRGAGPASLVWDIPGGLSGLPEEISPSDGDSRGPIRLREAMAGGYLIPAAETLLNLGAESVASTAAPFGLDLQPDAADPLALLTGEVPLSPLDVAQAYGVFAADGILGGQSEEEVLRNWALLKVEDAENSIWWDWTRPQRQAVVSGPLAFLVNDVLSQPTPGRRGGASALELDRPAARLRGETLEGSDSWAAGYTPRRAVAVWTGAESAVLPEVSAGVWHALAQAASAGLAAEGWAPPPGISAVQVCDPSGLLPGPACPSVVKEYFLSGSEPVDADDLFAVYPVNRETGFLATVFTPLGLVERRTYMMVPEAARSWAASAGLPAPPESFDTIQYAPPGNEVNISSPEMFADVAGKVTVTGSAGGEAFLLYRLQYGAGLNPQSWYQIGEDVTTPVREGKLGEWDTTGLQGLYVLQLQVVYTDQRRETAAVVVNVASPTATP